jgi:GTP pyrophosphokinase
MALSARFVEAVAYAAEVHARQVRKQTRIPYLAHLLGVSSIALEHGADEEEAIAALLHDVIEDHGPGHREPIRDRFGERVLEIVLGCTDAEGEPKPPWKERKLRYVAHLPGASASIHLVSASDKLHNLRSIVRDYRINGETLWPRFRAGREGTLWYYSELAKSLTKAPEPLQIELQVTLDELHSLLNGVGAGHSATGAA